MKKMGLRRRKRMNRQHMDQLIREAHARQQTFIPRRILALAVPAAFEELGWR